jgi:hypothetical protein
VRSCGLDSFCSEQDPVTGSSGDSIELSDSIKGGEFLDQLSGY